MMAMATKGFRATIKKAAPGGRVLSSEAALGVKYFDRLRGKCKFMQITSIKTFRFFLCARLGLYDSAKMAGRSVQLIFY